MNKWLKRISLSVLAIIAVVVVVTYIQLKSMGVIPKEDFDTVAPTLPEFSKPAVLVFTKTNGFIHRDAIPVAKTVFGELITAQGWEVYQTDNAAVHTPELLTRFDFIIWNNVSGNVLLPEQRTAMKEWLESGGGWLGVHASGGDRSYDWQWYVDTLLGAQFTGHTMDPQFQDALILVATESQLTTHLPEPWKIEQEEWYAFASNPRDKGYEILLTADESSYETVGEHFLYGNDRMDGEHPLAWRHRLGEGRVLYSAIGHQPDTYRLPEYQEFLTRAMHWVRGKDD